MSTQQQPRLTELEWDAFVSASAQLEVDWHQEGDETDRRRYAAFERGRLKVLRHMGPVRADS
jgi:hypothetical protein